MRIEKDLSIPANDFYDQIMDSVIFDVRKATGKTLSRKQLEGFQYVKEFSTTSRAKIEIETETTKNEFVARYEVTPLDGKSSKVIYTETMKSHGFMQQLNDMLLGTILGYFKRKQFKKMLSMMEEAY